MECSASLSYRSELEGPRHLPDVPVLLRLDLEIVARAPLREFDLELSGGRAADVEDRDVVLEYLEVHGDRTRAIERWLTDQPDRIVRQLDLEIEEESRLAEDR